MLKVIFKVEKLVLKLKNIQCQIIAKKDQHTLPLSPPLLIQHGEVVIGSETEFLIVQNDPLFLLQVTLNSQGVKKLGGEISVNIADWDENVHYSTVAGLKKSPDRQSQICYTFLYIRKDYLASEKSLILCSEYRDQNLIEMEGRKRELTRKQNKLQDQIKKLKQDNRLLQSNEQMRKQEINIKKIDHDRKIKNIQETIEMNSAKNDDLKKKNEEMMRLIEIYGQEETKRQLLRRYPHRIDENDGHNKMQDESQRDLEANIRSKDRAKRRPSSDIGQGSEIHDRERSREKKRGTGRAGDEGN